MSIDTCKSCSRYVDTDFDTDAYAVIDADGNTIGERNHCLCERCREEEFKKTQEEKQV